MAWITLTMPYGLILHIPTLKELSPERCGQPDIYVCIYVYIYIYTDTCIVKDLRLDGLDYTFGRIVFFNSHWKLVLLSPLRYIR